MCYSPLPIMICSYFVYTLNISTGVHTKVIDFDHPPYPTFSYFVRRVMYLYASLQVPVIVAVQFTKFCSPEKPLIYPGLVLFALLENVEDHTCHFRLSN